MPKYLDGIKRVIRQKPAPVEKPAEERGERMIVPGVKKLSGALLDMFDARGKIQSSIQRKEQRRALQIAKKEEKARQEQERLRRLAAEHTQRSEKLWHDAIEAKQWQEKKKKEKEKQIKAKAKLKAQRLAAKLQKHSSVWTPTLQRARQGGNTLLGDLSGMLSAAVRALITYLQKIAQNSARYVAFALLCLVFVVSVLSTLAYATPAQSSVRQVLVHTLPFPAFIVDYRPVSYASYLDEKRLLGDYYFSQYVKTNPSAVVENIDANLLKEALVRNHLIEKSIFRRLQRGYGVEVSPDEQEGVFVSAAQSYGGVEVLTEAIYNDYGLTKDLFMERVMFYHALKPKLAEAFVRDNAVHQNARVRMQNVKEILEKGNQSFEDLAKKYSEDDHALKGGDSGYIKVSDMSEELRAAVSKLDIGRASDVLQEEGRYYLVKVYDRSQTKAGEEVWIKQISIFTNYNFENYLKDLKAQAKVWDLTR